MQKMETARALQALRSYVDYPLTKTEMTIGRGKHSDIRIASHFISRIHATIKTQGAATVIEDAGSKNGILVNSSRVESCVKLACLKPCIATVWPSATSCRPASRVSPSGRGCAP